MKKISFLALCFIVLLCLFGCGSSGSDKEAVTTTPAETALLTEQATDAAKTDTPDTYITSNAYYKIFPAKKTSNKVDTTYVERYLLLSGNYPNYHDIIRNVPNIYSYFVNSTPDELKRKCVIYKCTFNGTSLGGETFLVYGEDVFSLCGDYYGYGGGYGVTEFAYHEAEDKLYFIYSFGSGVISTHVGVLDFKTRTIGDYNLSADDTLELPPFPQASFCLSEEKDTLGLCLAYIQWSSYENRDVDIYKGECFLEDITALEFREIVPKNED